MVLNLFKLCVVINSHDDYKCVSFWWPLTFTQGHRISGKVNARNTVPCESYEHLLFLYELTINREQLKLQLFIFRACFLCAAEMSPNVYRSGLTTDQGSLSSDNDPDYVPESETDSISEGVYVLRVFFCCCFFGFFFIDLLEKYVLTIIDSIWLAG